MVNLPQKLKNGRNRTKKMITMNGKKKSSEMTFKEFFEEAKKEGIDSEEIESTKCWILNALCTEGFTEEQINDMKMEKVWKFTLDIISVFMDQDMTEIAMALQQRIITPQQLQILNKFLKEFKEKLKNMVEELEEELKKKQKKE